MADASLPVDAWGRSFTHPDYGRDPSATTPTAAPGAGGAGFGGAQAGGGGFGAPGSTAGGSDGLGAGGGGGDLPCCVDPCVDPCSGLTPREAEALAAAEQELAVALALAEALLAELIGNTKTELDSLAGLVSAITDEVIGATDLLIGDGEGRAIKLVMALVSAIDRELNSAVDWCLTAGIQVPYLPGEQASLLGGNWIDLLISAFPQLAGVLTGSGGDGGDGGEGGEGGGSYGVPISTPYEPVDGFTPTGGGGTGAGGGVSPPTSPLVPPPPPPGTVVTPGTLLRPGSTTTTTTTSGGSTTTSTIYGNTIPTIPPPGVPPPPGVTVNLTVPTPSVTVNVPPPITPPDDDGAEPGVAAVAAGPGEGINWNVAVKAPAVSQLNAVNWNDPAACGHASRLAAAPAANLGAAQGGGEGTVMGNYLKGKLQLKNWAPLLLGPLGIPFELKQLFDAWAKTESAQNATLETMAMSLAQETYIGTIGAQAVPNKAAATFFGAKIAGARFLESKTQFPLDYLMTGDLLLFQYANPQYIPNQIRVDDAFLSATIDGPLWECWTRANGNHPEPARRVMLANQVRPDIGDLVALYRRGHMTLESLFLRCREKGVLDPNYVREWLAVSTQLPGQPDLIRFMVRDASDDAVAKEYGYDSGFNEKYSPQIKAWAIALGVDESYLRMQWRAHWEIPSWTQLAEMFHRLRPGRREVREWDHDAKVLGEHAAELGRGPRPRVVDLDDVRTALQINDMAPAWIDNLISISYTPITRTDAVRAYQIGAFDEERLADAFLDVGYSPASTRDLVAFHAQDKARRRANVTGTWSTRKITTYYKRGYLGRAEAEKLLGPLTSSAQEVKDTLDSADSETAADTRKAAVNGVKRGLMSGELDDKQANGQLVGFGVGPTVADRLVTSWVIERDTRYKRLSAAQAAKALKDGLISAEELRRRLKNLGYVSRDADLLLAKALEVEGGTDGLEPSELDSAIGEAVKTRKDAARQGASRLGTRLRQLVREWSRIAAELNRRREGTEQPLIPGPPMLP